MSFGQTQTYRKAYGESDTRTALRARSAADLAGFPYYPLSSPGMPPPGPDFLQMAEQLAYERTAPIDADLKTAQEAVKQKVKGAKTIAATLQHARDREVLEQCDVLYRSALYNTQFRLNLHLKGRQEAVQLIAGHHWGGVAQGPIPLLEGRPTRVLVLGKNPGPHEAAEGLNFFGPSSLRLVNTLCEVGAEDVLEWYMTNVVRHLNPNAALGDSKVTAAWVKNCQPLLANEIRILRPQFLLCLGSEATKAALGAKATLSGTQGRAFKQKVSLSDSESFELTVLTCMHPAAVDHEPERMPDFVDGLTHAVHFINGGTSANEYEPDYEVTDVLLSTAELREWALRIEEYGYREFAVDLEWEGDDPSAPGYYVRTIQIAWDEQHAAVIAITTEGGGRIFDGTDAEICQILEGLLHKPNKRLIGHYFAADAPKMVQFGMPWVLEQFLPPTEGAVHFDETGNDVYSEAWELTQEAGGFDTNLAAHAVCETDEFGLKPLALRRCRAKRWDIAIEEFLTEHCKKHKIKKKDLTGYGPVPDEILWLYGGGDAVNTFRLFKKYNLELLDCDQYGNCVREAFHRSMRAWQGFTEATCTGFRIDMERAEELRQMFAGSADALLQDVQRDVAWPKFNPNSVYEVRELLFGEEYNGKQRSAKDKHLEDGKPIILRPEGARTLALTPYKTSGNKGSKLWAEVVRRRQENLYTPSTDKETKVALAGESKTVAKLLDYSSLHQVNKAFLRNPRKDKATGQFVRVYADENDGEDGDFTYDYDEGLLGFVRNDGRIYPNYSQTKETSRASSWKPNCQNFSQKAEKDYKRILKDRYKHSLRSIVIADEDEVLIKADITAAEVCVAAWMSGDPTMLEHARRSCLPEDDPDYFDIHCSIACRTFGLKCAPTKEAFKAAGFTDLRNAAKTRFFGWFYGQGALAAWRKIKAECPDLTITVEDVQSMTDDLEQTYPGVVALFHQAYGRVSDPGWVCYGGVYRRCIASQDEGVRKGQEREFANAIIQGYVAVHISEAMWETYDWRRHNPHLRFNFTMQVHDELLFRVPIEHAREVYQVVIPECMSRRLPFVPTDMDGFPTGDGPYLFGVDAHIQQRWSEPLDKDFAKKHGLTKEDLAIHG